MATPAAPQTQQALEWETPTTPKKTNIFSRYNLFNAQSTLPTKNEEPAAERATKRSFSDRFIPHWCAPFFGRSRKPCLFAVAALLLLILILGLGLGLGLHKGKSHKNLPLPSDTATLNGDFTYYSPGPGYGACGYENTASDSICAVSHLLWDAVSTSSNPNANPLCGKKIRIDRYDAAKGGNRSLDVMVVDRCTGCQETDLDLSLSVFTTVAEEAQGRVVGSWAWLS